MAGHARVRYSDLDSRYSFRNRWSTVVARTGRKMTKKSRTKRFETDTYLSVNGETGHRRTRRRDDPAGSTLEVRERGAATGISKDHGPRFLDRDGTLLHRGIKSVDPRQRCFRIYRNARPRKEKHEGRVSVPLRRVFATQTEAKYLFCGYKGARNASMGHSNPDVKPQLGVTPNWSRRRLEGPRRGFAARVARRASSVERKRAKNERKPGPHPPRGQSRALDVIATETLLSSLDRSESFRDAAHPVGVRVPSGTFFFLPFIRS